MPPFFDPRRMARTPGFAPDGLYDDEQEPMPPLPDRIVPSGQQSQMGLGGMVNAAPAQLEPIREFDSPRQNPMLNPPPRQRIQLPSAPLPPKVGKMRQILGHAAAVFMPEVGTEIAAPGYSREVREYNAQKQRLMDEAKINEAAAQEEYHIANSRAAMARAEASNAQRDRTRGQQANDGNFTLGGDQARFDPSGRRIASNPLPPKPAAPGMRITTDEARRRGLYVEPGAENVELPSGGASAYLNTLPRADKGYDTLKQSIRDANPGWDQADVDAEASKQYKDQRKLEADKKVAETKRAERPYAGRSTGLSAAGQNAEDRRAIEDRSNEAVLENGGLDQAISNISQWSTRDDMAEKVLAHLKAMKGKKMASEKTTTTAAERRRMRRGGAAPAAEAPKSTGPKIGEVKSGYRFKGGDPGSQSNWEKVN